MSNLIPTVITDVNGKVTTVHRRSAGTRTMKQDIPAPGMPLAPKLVTRQAMKDFEAVGIKILDTPYGNNNLFHLAKRHPAILKELYQRVQTAGDLERRIWKHMITNLPLHELGRQKYDPTPYKYREWFSLLPMAVELFPPIAQQNSNHEAMILYDRIKSLSTAIEQVERQQGRPAVDDGYRRVKAIMAVIQIDKAAGGTGRLHNREDDIDYINANMEAVEPIIPELMKRGTTDRGVIQQILDSYAPSLNSGIL